MSDSSSEKAPTATEQEPGRAVATTGAAPELSVTKIKEILESQGLRVDPAKASVVLQQVRTEIVKAHIGPLPTVEDFAGYNEVCPGSAQEILDMAVRQQKHSHHMDKYGAGSEFWLPVIGIAAAVTIVVGMFAAGVYLAMNGHENLAIGVLSGTGIVTVVGAFLQRGKTEDHPAPSPPPARPEAPLTRRQRRERAAQARKNQLNR
jgi:uncharacterized membrane protein